MLAFSIFPLFAPVERRKPNNYRSGRETRKLTKGHKNCFGILKACLASNIALQVQTNHANHHRKRPSTQEIGLLQSYGFFLSEPVNFRLEFYSVLLSGLFYTFSQKKEMDAEHSFEITFNARNSGNRTSHPIRRRQI